jgi:hypothetical protein
MISDSDPRVGAAERTLRHGPGHLRAQPRRQPRRRDCAVQRLQGPRQRDLPPQGRRRPAPHRNPSSTLAWKTIRDGKPYKAGLEDYLGAEARERGRAAAGLRAAAGRRKAAATGREMERSRDAIAGNGGS